MAAYDDIQLCCTMNTFSDELHPSDIIRLVARIGYAGVDLNCDGPFYPYSDRDIGLIGGAARDCGIRICNVNSMTTTYFWREFPEAIPINKFDGPDFSDSPQTYNHFGVRSVEAWRLSRIADCLQIANKLGVPRINLNAGKWLKGEGKEEIWPQVLTGLRKVIASLGGIGKELCIETEPGLFIAGPPDIERVMREIPSNYLRWGCDVGHLIKYYRGDHQAVIRDMRTQADIIGYFHLEDIARTDWEGDMMTHTHLSVGKGDMDFQGLIETIVHLSRARRLKNTEPAPCYYENYHSYDVDDDGSARESYEILVDLVRKVR